LVICIFPKIKQKLGGQLEIYLSVQISVFHDPILDMFKGCDLR